MILRYHLLIYYDLLLELRSYMKTVEHLIETFVPENYNIFLDINRQTKTFTGNVAINGEALDNHVAFHQKDLDIKSILLDNEAVIYQVDNDNEVVRVELPETGMMTLVIEFSGSITDNMTGIYPSYYTKNGEKKEVISTQFESHFAREAFPCIDEPQAKATFDLSLTFDQEIGEIALSNMPEVNIDRREETGLWTFDTTPRMSSYLLAFALGELHGKTVESKKEQLLVCMRQQRILLARLIFHWILQFVLLTFMKTILEYITQSRNPLILRFQIFHLVLWKIGV